MRPSPPHTSDDLAEDAAADLADLAGAFAAIASLDGRSRLGTVAATAIAHAHRLK
jgi:hypothetical protein